VSKSDIKIGIIGLGYVGLPLAVAFARKYPVVAYDIDINRVIVLNQGLDTSRETIPETIQNALVNGLRITADKTDLATANIYIVTVPTPVTASNEPDLTALRAASKLVAQYLKQDDIVIYESTVYPGATEEVCVPILVENSHLVYNKDFFVGYSPERISPGDKEHRLENIIKITSGSTPEIAQKIDKLYQTIIAVGTYLAPSIQVAEAAKVIENTQRDMNIAFVNELAQLFSLMDLDTQEVLKAAGTKWNFLPFQPGLVGGHCIGVDTHYLTYKAKQLGFEPKLIDAGRTINASMGNFVAQRLVKMMLAKDIALKNAKVLVAGITIKENVTDIRNARAVDVVRELASYGLEITVLDTWADVEEVKEVYTIDLVTDINTIKTVFDALIITVAHEDFKNMDFSKVLKDKNVIFDLKSVLEDTVIDGRL